MLILSSTSVFASNFLNYSGRLVNPNGSPVTGPVDLTLDLAYTNDTNTILCTKSIAAVPLVNGIFHLKLDFTCGSDPLNEVLLNAPVGETIAIRVTDTTPTPDKVYAFQAVYSVPYTKVAETTKKIGIKGTSVGQVLKWDGTEWVPGAAAASSGGTVTDITAGTGLSGGTITTSGTIAIANGGVTTTEIANGTIADVDISATAAITRAKLAGGTPNYVIVNNGAGQISEVQTLSLSQGGTGAVDALNARINLGLGSAALAGIGNAAGNVMQASDVPSCLPSQKLQMGVGPAYPWTCVSDVDTADTTKLPLAGGTMAGDINMDANKITDLAGPTDDGDAANKKYVDDTIAGSSYWTKTGNDLDYNAGKVGIGDSIRFKDSGTNYVELRAPSTVASSIAFTLPGIYGTSGQVLTTNGSGTLSWSTVATTSTTVGGDLTGTISAAEIAAGAIVDADINAGANIAQSKIAGLTTALSNKEPTITAPNNTTTYFRGDKTFQTLDTSVVPENGNLYFTDTRVRAATLTGFTTATTDVVAGDSVLTALGKLQGQIDASDTTLSNAVLKTGSTMTGPLILDADPTNVLGAATKQYVDNLIGSNGQWSENGTSIFYSAGKVGIGTNTPNANLEISNPGVSGSLDYNLIVKKTAVADANSSAVGILLSTEGAGSNGKVGVVHERTSSYGIGKLHFLLNSTTDYSNPTLANAKMTIQPDGNVGIGTSNPTTKLQVVGYDNTNPNVSLANTSALDVWNLDGGFNSTAQINFRADGHAGIPGIGAVIGYVNKSSTAAVGSLGDLVFGVKNDAADTSVIHALTIKRGGNVGIATSSPTSKLHVKDGGIQVQDAPVVGSTRPSFVDVQNGFETIKLHSKAGSAAGYVTAPTDDLYLGSGTIDQALTVKLDGKVGVGTVSPGVNFHVAGANGFPATSGTAQTGSFRVGTTVSQRVLDFGINGATSTAWMQATTMNSLGDKNNLAINPNGGFVGVGTKSPAQALQVKGAIAYETDNSSNYVSLRAPNSLAASYALTLPSAVGSAGQVLTTDAAGVLSWSTVATTSDLSTKEPTITAAGNTTTYWRGDKTWATLNTTIVPEGTNMYHTSARVMTSVLGGYTVGTAIPLATTDTVSEAFGKLEASLTAISTGAQWSKNGSSYYYNGGNVGIGTSTPGNKLDIVGGGIYIPSADGIMFHDHGTGNGADGDEGIYGSNAQVRIKANGGDVASFNAGGSVGIGTNSPLYKLDVAGNIRSTSQIFANGGTQSSPGFSFYSPEVASDTGMFNPSDGVLAFSTDGNERLRIYGANVGIGTTTPTSKLQVMTSANSAWAGHFQNDGTSGAHGLYVNLGASSDGTPFRVDKNGTSLLTLANNGNLGVGTNSPAAKLNIKAGTEGQSGPVTAMMIDGPNTPADPNSAQDIHWRFASAGSAIVRGYRGSTWDSYLQFMTNRLDGVNNSQLNVRMHINHDGKVGIGTTAPSELLDVNGNIIATAYLYTSDKRLKKNIETIQDPLKKVLALRGVNYEWKKDNNKSIGFIAQEVELIFPEAVKTSKTNGMKSVEYGNLVAPLLEAFKTSHTNHEARIKTVEAENKKLKNENEDLKKRLDRLEQLVMRNIASEKKRP